ncbi:MAG: redoxin domain-containing protein [Anaerolineales bacterium]|nr:redoxin domain-containing protein [Anaerolineales bacterium]
MDSLIKINQPAPNFELPDLEGVAHRLVSTQGRVLVLNFWSAECPWAKRGDEILADLRPTWGDRVELWSIASNANETDEQLALAAAVREPGLVLRDAEHAVADLYGAVTTPHFFVIDEKGDLRYRGAPDDTSFRQSEPTVHYLEDAVEALLNSREPNPAESAGYGCTIIRHAL